MTCPDRFPVPLLAVVLTAVLVSGCSDSALENWREHQAGVVRLTVESVDGSYTGTAFAVNNDGYFATNHHVIEAGRYGEIMAVESTSPSVIFHPVAEIVWSDAGKDLAIIRLPSWTAREYTLVSSSDIDAGHEVYSSGFPGSNDSMTAGDGIDNPAYTVPTLKDGMISERIEQVRLTIGQTRVDLFEHSATVNAGNSGGPLFDSCGRVVGINVAKAASSIHLGSWAENGIDSGNAEARFTVDEGAFYAVASNELITALQDQGIEHDVSQTPCSSAPVSIVILYTMIAIVILLVILLTVGLAYLVRNRKSEKAVQLGKSTQAEPSPRDLPSGFKRMADLFTFKKKASSENQMAVENRDVYRGESGEIVHAGGCRLLPLNTGLEAIALLPGQTLIVGRDPNRSAVAINHESISRQHAKIRWNDGKLVVVDLNSSSGTFVDGYKVDLSESGTLVRPGQIVSFGSDAVSFRMESSDEH